MSTLRVVCLTDGRRAQSANVAREGLVYLLLGFLLSPASWIPPKFKIIDFLNVYSKSKSVIQCTHITSPPTLMQDTLMELSCPHPSQSAS